MFVTGLRPFPSRSLPVQLQRIEQISKKVRFRFAIVSHHHLFGLAGAAAGGRPFVFVAC